MQLENTEKYIWQKVSTRVSLCGLQIHTKPFPLIIAHYSFISCSILMIIFLPNDSYNQSVENADVTFAFGVKERN